MILKNLVLQNFRSYSKSSFEFDPATTLIIGPNTSGKTNLVEAIFLMSTGKSFRADKDIQMIKFSQDLGRVKSVVERKQKKEKTELEVVISTGVLESKETPQKKYLVNGVSKRRQDFAGNFPTVLFSPQDLDIIIESPFLRRRFLDSILEQVDRAYRFALTSYIKALRQRNALLDKTREALRLGGQAGARNERQFEYWDHILIENGELITKKREEFIFYINNSQKNIFDFAAFYDKSTISKARLLQYKEAELAAGVTLVGPHRDDFILEMFNDQTKSTKNLRFFGSRGQQRLAILQLKLLELSYIEEGLVLKPVLILDDIFSELDEDHIKLVLEIIPNQQTIITTTHEELVPKSFLTNISAIKLKEL